MENATNLDGLAVSPGLAAELAAVMVKIARVTVRAELHAARGATIGAYAGRVRHDRTPLPRRGVLSAIRAGSLVATKIGKFWYIERAELDRYFAAHATVEPQGRAAEVEDDFAAAMRRCGIRKGAVANDRGRGAPAPRVAARGPR